MMVTPHRSGYSSRWLRAAVLAAATWLTTSPLIAATCTIDAQGVNFGSYDFQSTQNLDSVGHVGVTCDVDTSYSIALSPGAGSYATRLMQNGPHQLAYNLYTDVIHSTVWGDGSGNSDLINGSGTDADYPVYGSMPAGQNPYVGAYSDVVTVVLTF
jgi:spore coat protein U-like protein